MAAEAFPLQRDALRVLRLQGSAWFSFRLALMLGVATGLFVTFFVHDEWRALALQWAIDEGHSALVMHIATGEFAGIAWRGWAAIGAGGTGLLLYLWVRGMATARRKVAATPGLDGAVAAERRRRSDEKWAMVGIALVLIFLPLAIAWAIGHSQDDCDHRDPWDPLNPDD